MKHSAYYIICALVLTANSGWAREDGVRETVTYLSSLGSRVSGYPGGGRRGLRRATPARDRVAEVVREPFSVTVPIDQGGELLLTESGERYGLYSLWPNLVRTSTPTRVLRRDDLRRGRRVGGVRGPRTRRPGGAAGVQ